MPSRHQAFGCLELLVSACAPFPCGIVWGCSAQDSCIVIPIPPASESTIFSPLDGVCPGYQIINASCVFLPLSARPSRSSLPLALPLRVPWFLLLLLTPSLFVPPPPQAVSEIVQLLTVLNNPAQAEQHAQAQQVPYRPQFRVLVVCCGAAAVVSGEGDVVVAGSAHFPTSSNSRTCGGDCAICLASVCPPALYYCLYPRIKLVKNRCYMLPFFFPSDVK